MLETRRSQCIHVLYYFLLTCIQVKSICPIMPAPFLSSQVMVAASGVALSSPTPTPFSTA